MKVGFTDRVGARREVSEKFLLRALGVEAEDARVEKVDHGLGPCFSITISTTDREAGFKFLKADFSED